jgi:hypothetical protein
VLDTRLGVGGTLGPLGPSGRLTLDLAGLAEVPDNATGVTLNVTAANGTSHSYLALFPSRPGTPPLVSNLNWSGPSPAANLVSVALGTNGKIDVFNAAGSVDVVADLAGYYTVGGGLPGAPGPIGPSGPAGPPGQPGQPGPGGVFSAYSLYANLQTVPSGGAIAFPNIAAQIGTDVAYDGQTFTIGAPGVYRVFYGLTVDASSPSDGSASMRINGQQRGPVRRVAAGVGGIQSVSDSLVFTAAAGDVLKIIVDSASSTSLSAASIEIERIK